MKTLNWMIFGLALFAASPSWASGTVCAGARIHHVSSQVDRGTAPHEGEETGHEFFSIEGELQGKVTYFYGRAPEGELNWEIGFENQHPVARGGVLEAGWSIYSATLVATSVEDRSVVLRESVTCTQTWLFVP